jgi:O-succinylbenzoic acid--CoA ligase
MTFSVFAAGREAPDSLAVITSEESLTYATLRHRALIAATWLKAHGVLDFDAGPVALVATPDLATLEMLYALVTFGIPVLLVHARLTTAERAALFARCRPALVIDSSWRLTAPRKVLSFNDPYPTPEQTLCIIPSSGTSGEPKLNILSRRAFVASARASARNLDWRSDDRWLLCLPLAHVGGLSIVMRTWLARRTLVVASDTNGDTLAHTMTRQRATLASLVPTLLSRFPATFKPPPELRAVLLGGAPPPPALVEEYRARQFPLLTTYGLTEACSQVCTQPYAERLEKPRVERSITSSGVPLAGTNLRVRDDVIEIKGPTLFSGYFGNGKPELLEDGWFRTGDRGFIDDRGELFVTGRTSELIIAGGENVDPLEVEAALLNLKGVKAACVFGIEDATFGQSVAVALTVEAGATLQATKLADFAKANLASHKQPRHFAILKELSYTPAGKVDRKAVRKLALPKLVALTPAAR